MDVFFAFLDEILELLVACQSFYFLRVQFKQFLANFILLFSWEQVGSFSLIQNALDVLQHFLAEDLSIREQKHSLFVADSTSFEHADQVLQPVLAILVLLIYFDLKDAESADVSGQFSKLSLPLSSYAHEEGMAIRSGNNSHYPHYVLYSVLKEHQVEFVLHVFVVSLQILV